MLPHIAAHLVDAVREIPGDEVDSHAVIRVLASRLSREYVLELYEHVDQPDPIQFAHLLIGRALADLGTLEKVDRIDTSNVRGNFTENQLWRRKR